MVRRMMGDDSGATAIEYAMIAGSVAVVIVSAVNLLGENVKTVFFDRIAAAM
jgi:pilus assembly protein Flp/PilA